MITPSFLDKVASEIIAISNISNAECIVVLPNKRAKVFLLESIKNYSKEIIFSPIIISIEELIQQIADMRTVDSIELLFEFYEVYLSVTKQERQSNFELFSNWAKIVLQDFNEIDRYLIEPNYVFSYLKEVEALKRWDLEPQNKTELIDLHLEFWNKLPLYYESFYKHLLSKKVGYQGLIYREAVRKINEFSESLKEKVIFAGFNALNKAEEKIMLHLLSNSQAKVFWDIDYTFLNDSYHDAGLFIRRFKKEWKPYLSQDFEWITTVFQEEKNIEIIGTPKAVGQAKIVGNIIASLQENNENINKTAVVLGDENFLIPILYGLPDTVESLNITMGYSGKNNPAQLLISKLFKLHSNAISRNEQAYTLYYKEVLDVLNHPLVEPYLEIPNVVQTINNNNFTFFSLETLFRVKNEKHNEGENQYFDLLFQPWNTSVEAVLDTILNILLTIKDKLSNEIEEEKITKAFVYSLYKVINKLKSYHLKYNKIDDLESLFGIYKQIIDLAEVSFEGEPLSGLQIMGVLESRVLDFENVIITSVNEGKFPAGKSQQSFIPYDIKLELGLPTFKEKDAIYSYHFYHLLMRAKNIYLLYNSDAEGIDAGEKSRFITQLEIEKQPKHSISHKIYNALLPEKAYQPMVVSKSDKVIDRIKEIATVKGFSPSSLTSYIRNPIQFYFQRILRINEVEEVEESIALNTLGTIIHETLEALYKPYINQFLTIHYLDAMLAKIDTETAKQFKEVYKEGEIRKGKNLLAFEVAKRNVFNFLQVERNAIENGDAVKVLFLEEKLEVEIHDENLPFLVKIAGNVDRIELRNNSIRIIDYKTGKVEANTLKINDFENLTSDIKNEKIIQLLCYALMFQQKTEFQQYPIEAGIVSFKNMKAGFMPFGLGKGRGVTTQTVINQEILDDFKTEIIGLINEILNKEVDFRELS